MNEEKLRSTEDTILENLKGRIEFTENHLYKTEHTLIAENQIFIMEALEYLIKSN